MKGTAALLILMGAILILAPGIMDYLYQITPAARTANAQDVARGITGGYRTFMIVFGVFMVMTGIGMGFTALERGQKT